MRWFPRDVAKYEEWADIRMACSMSKKQSKKFHWTLKGAWVRKASRWVDPAFNER